MGNCIRDGMELYIASKNFPFSNLSCESILPCFLQIIRQNASVCTFHAVVEHPDPEASSNLWYWGVNTNLKLLHLKTSIAIFCTLIKHQLNVPVLVCHFSFQAQHSLAKCLHSKPSALTSFMDNSLYFLCNIIFQICQQQAVVMFTPLLVAAKEQSVYTCTSFLHSKLTKCSDQVIEPLLHNWEIPGSNLTLKTSCTDCRFLGFPQSLKADGRIVP
jgi:hypothetical protein